MKRLVIATAIASAAVVGLRAVGRHCRQLCAEGGGTSGADQRCGRPVNSNASKC